MEHILFDLDGTLTDPAVGITGAVAHALQKLGHTPPPRSELEYFIGPPLDEGFRQKYGFDDATILAAVEYFREYFTATGIYENELYPGMPGLLQALLAAGKTLYVATSKPTVFAHKILERFSLAQYFTDVEGSPLTHHGLPKAQVVQTVLERNHIPPENAVMVGDRKHDIIGGQKNGLVTVGVLYGYGSREEFEAAGAGHIAESVPALQALLLGL